MHNLLAFIMRFASCYCLHIFEGSCEHLIDLQELKYQRWRQFANFIETASESVHI